ncbi:MAG: MarR family transcriptional regulator [Candidatus Thermoplasmatota archaeon]|nr:MarR family transcriptional regulator [Candidatus Thermoplasmatota archaeon]MDD5778189.1 MarR family transcriptional regulator [Candidatus Thermoplasmatota archaeon]
MDEIAFKIFMFVDQGRTQAEIAELLEITPQAVHKRIKRYLGQGLLKESKPQTMDKRYLTLGPDKIYVITQKGREFVFKGFRRELVDEVAHCIHAIRYFLDTLEKHLMVKEKHDP